MLLKIYEGFSLLLMASDGRWRLLIASMGSDGSYADFPTSGRGNLLNNYCLLDPSASSFSGHPTNVSARLLPMTSR